MKSTCSTRGDVEKKYLRAYSSSTVRSQQCRYVKKFCQKSKVNFFLWQWSVLGVRAVGFIKAYGEYFVLQELQNCGIPLLPFPQKTSGDALMNEDQDVCLFAARHIDAGFSHQPCFCACAK